MTVTAARQAWLQKPYDEVARKKLTLTRLRALARYNTESDADEEPQRTTQRTVATYVGPTVAPAMILVA
jgi:hypothetical protein